MCGDVDAVTHTLALEPAGATRPDGEAGPGRTGAGGEGDLVKKDWGSKGWEPLSYLCFTRLPLPSVAANAAAIARPLLDHGADPNVSFRAGGSSYTPLVGAIGEGEEGRPPHPARDALVRLLLERGANPYDSQVVYNLLFNGSALWFLETIHEHTMRIGKAADWADPEWRMLDAGPATGRARMVSRHRRHA